jgi:hypothetical protein
MPAALFRLSRKAESHTRKIHSSEGPRYTSTLVSVLVRYGSRC